MSVCHAMSLLYSYHSMLPIWQCTNRPVHVYDEILSKTGILLKSKFLFVLDSCVVSNDDTKFFLWP